MAEIIRYVDPDATGSGTGVDWTNAYTSLNAWNTGEATNLVTDGNTHHVYCRSSSGSADNTAITISGWTTDATHDITIEAASGDEALKTGWDSSRYRLTQIDATPLNINEDFVTIKGLQISSIYSATESYAIRSDSAVGTGATINIDSCRIEDGRGFFLKDADLTVNIYNTIINARRFCLLVELCTANVNYCIIRGNNTGVGVQVQASTILNINNSVIFNTTDDVLNNGTLNMNYCATDDGDGSNPISPYGSDWSNEFSDPTGNFTLLNTGNLFEGGIPVSIVIDMEGDSRDETNPDVGVDEYISGIPKNYYIDYVSGSDTNDGLTTTTPFKHSPDDDNATDTAASITLIPGDVVVFKGGVTYSGQINCVVSGVSDNKIGYKSGHLATYNWGSGNAIINGSSLSALSANEGIINIDSQDYIVVEGLEIINSPSGSDSYSGNIGFNGEHTEIINCKIHGSYKNGIVGYGIYATGTRTNGVDVENCEIYENGGHGILLLRGITNVNIINNEIYDNGYPEGAGASDGIFMGGDGQGDNTITNIVIRGNEIYDHPGKGPLILSGETVLIEKNYFHDEGLGGNDYGDEIGLSIYANTVTQDVIIRNNLFDTSPYYEGVINIKAHWGTDAYIDGVEIYNNTFIKQGRYYLLDVESSISIRSDAISNVSFKNNIVKLTDTGSSNQALYVEDSDASNGFASDYNHYIRGSSGIPNFYWEGSQYTFDNWKTTLGFDTFTYSGHGTDPLVNENFTLNIASPCIDEGVDLSSTGFSDDYFGTTRDSNWDIGAFEYVISPPSEKNIIKTITSLILHKKIKGFKFR